MAFEEDVPSAPSPKQMVLEMLTRMPDDCTVEDIGYELYVCDRIHKGLKALAEGNICTHQEAEARIRSRLEKWRRATESKKQEGG